MEYTDRTCCEKQPSAEYPPLKEKCSCMSLFVWPGDRVRLFCRFLAKQLLVASHVLNRTKQSIMGNQTFFKKTNPYRNIVVLFIFFPVATQENGRQNPQVPSSQQRDICHPEQVPEVWGRGEHAGGTRPMLPTTNTPVAGQQLRCCCCCGWCSLDQHEVPNTVTITRPARFIPPYLRSSATKDH